MASFTRFSPKRFERVLHPLGQWVRACLCALLLGIWGAALYAQTAPDQPAVQEAPEPAASTAPDVIQLQLHADDVLLTANLPFELPDLVADALVKGIPVHFVQEARLMAERWYWSDKQVFQVERHLRLSYQPLTRRWRLHSSGEPWSERKSTGIALGVSYDSLEDALAAMQRVAHWRVGDRAQLPSSGLLTMELTMRIDAAQLPRPLQIGTLGRSRWSVLASRISKVDVQALR